MTLVDKESKDTVNFMIILSVAGLLVKMFFDKSKPAEASIWGYGITAIAVLVMMVVTFANHSKSLKDMNNIKELASIFSLSIPSVLTILLLVWLIVINSSFSKLIDSGKYSHEYKYFSMFETIMMIIQIIIIFLMASSNDPATIGKYKSAVYLTTVFNFCFIGMMNIILYFFTTDG